MSEVQLLAPADPSPIWNVAPAGPRTDGEVRLTPERELELLEAHRRGDRAALAALLEGYQRRVYSVCYRMLHDVEESSDLTQEALIKIIEGLQSYDGRSKLSTWVIRVTMNCCLSHLRKKRLRRHESLDETPQRVGWRPVSGELSGPDHVEHAETRSELVGALNTLEPNVRAILVLRDLQDLDYNQIAAVLEVPVGTVRSRLFRARVALRAAAEAALSGRLPFEAEAIRRQDDP